MVGLNIDQRRMLIDKLPDAANLALGVLAFSQFVSGGPGSMRLIFSGMAIWLALIGLSLFFGKGGR